MIGLSRRDSQTLRRLAAGLVVVLLVVTPACGRPDAQPSAVAKPAAAAEATTSVQVAPTKPSVPDPLVPKTPNTVEPDKRPPAPVPAVPPTVPPPVSTVVIDNRPLREQLVGLTIQIVPGPDVTHLGNVLLPAGSQHRGSLSLTPEVGLFRYDFGRKGEVLLAGILTETGGGTVEAPVSIVRSTRVVDVVEAPLGPNEFVMTRTCTLDGRPDDLIIATSSLSDTKLRVKPAVLAWRFDPLTRRFVELKPSSVRCTLEGP